MNTKQRINSEKELRNFLNKEGIAKRMKLFAKLMLPPKFKLAVHFNVGRTCFTDWKSITIGVSLEENLGKTVGEIIMNTKATVIHEIGHILYSPETVYKKFMEDYSEKLLNEPGLENKESVIKQYVSNFLNSIEDGHDEYCCGIANATHKKYLSYMRGLWWKNNAIPDITKRIAKGMTEEQCELFDTTFAFCSLATMGILPKNFVQNYYNKTDVMDMIEEVKPKIFQYVSTPEMEDGLPHLWNIVDIIHPWVVELLKNIPEPDMNNLMNQLSNSIGGSSLGSGQGQVQSGNGMGNGSGGNSGNSSGSNSSGSNSSGSNSSGSNSGNSAGNNSGNSQNGSGNQGASGSSDTSSGGDGGRIGLNTDIDENDYETNMDAVVENAMREAKQELLESDEKMIVQADFDDLRNSGRHDEEDEGESSEEYQKMLQEYYDKLDASHRGGETWSNVGLQFKKYAPSIESEVPEDVKMESRGIKKEFTDILKDKVSQNSKNRRSGLLNTNDLWKLRTRDYKVFEQRRNPDETETVVYLLIDGSGSMSGNKFVEALRASSLLEEALRGLVPLKIVMFDFNGCVRHRIIKEFKAKDNRNYSWLFANEQRAGGCNMDGYSIRVAEQELLKRQEGQKILITLSDGQPNGCDGYYGEHAFNDVREAVNDCRRKGISVFNIFFASNKSEREEDLPGFIQMYQKGIVSCAPNEIGRELLRIIKRELKR